MIDDDNQNLMVERTAEIVSAYVANNSVPAAQLGELIANTFASLNGLTSAPVSNDTPDIATTPAVSIKKSVTPDHITCLFCAQPFKSLKRHIAASHGLSASQYRAHFSLNDSYPMVAPNYAATRSQLALSIGLGRRPGTKIVDVQAVKPVAAEAVTEPEKPAKPKRVRAKKAASDAISTIEE